MKSTDLMLPMSPMLPQQYTADVDYSQIPKKVSKPKAKAKVKAKKGAKEAVLHDTMQQDVIVEEQSDEPIVTQAYIPPAVGGAYVPGHYVVPSAVQVDTSAVGAGAAVGGGFGWGGTLLALGLGGALAYYGYDQYQKNQDEKKSTSTHTSTTKYTTGPSYESASFEGDKITLDLDQNLDAKNLPKASDFKIQVDGKAVDVTDISVSGDKMVLKVANSIQPGSKVTLDYTDPSSGNDVNAIQNTEGYDLGNLRDIMVKPSSSSDTTGPILKAGKIDGSKLTLTFDENLDFNHLPDLNAFKAINQDVKITGLSGNGKELILNFDKAIDTNKDFKLSYVDPSANNDTLAVQDVYGNDSGNFNYNYTYTPPVI